MITQVEARYFRRLKHIDVALAPGVTLVVGENGSGKSSLAAAIEFGLTGSCRWTDRRGAGYKVLINHEAADVGSTIVLQTDFTGLVERQLTPGGTALGVDGRDGSSAKALLSVNLPEPEILNAMLRSDGFTGLSPKEQQEVLFMLDGGRTGADWFRAHLTAEECEVLEERLASRATGSALSEKLHDAAYAMRTITNKQAATAQARLDQYRPPAQVEGSPSADELQEELAALRERQAALQVQMGVADSYQLAITRARARQESARDEIAQIEADLDALEDVAEPTAEAMAEAETDLETARVDMRNADAAAALAQAALEARRTQLERFIELGTSCVLGNIECPIDEVARERIIEQERLTLQMLEETLSAVEQEREWATRRAGEAADALGVLRDTKAKAEAILRHEGRLFDALEVAKGRLGEAVAEIAGAEQTDADALRQEAADLAAKIAEIERTLTAVAQYQEGVGEHEQLRREAEAASAKAELLNRLVAKLAPDGLPAQAMGAVIGEVLGRINEVLAQFTEFQLTAEPGPDFLLSVVRDGLETPVFTLSESEELRVGTAIQVALAALTGFGFVVVDAADRLDGKNRERLLRMLTQQEMVQALVLATPAGPMSDKQREALVGMGIKVMEIAEGEIVREAA